MNAQAGRQQIEKVLTLFNRDKKQVGSYLNHEITDDGDYLVTLSDGKLRLYFGDLLDAEKLLPFRCTEILARFRPTIV